MFKQKSKYFAAILMAVLITLAGASPSEAAPAASSVGYVDFIYLVEHHPDTAQANTALNAEREAAKKELAEKSAGLTDQEKQVLDHQLGQRLEQKRLELLKPISDQVVAAANEVAKEKSLSIVIDKREVVCGGVDITGDVLKKLGGK